MNAREETIERLREQAAAESTEEELPLEEPADEEETKVPITREYIVFIRVKGGSETWRELARIVAGSRESALKTLGNKLSADEEYAVCPSRNWSVGNPKIDTTVSVTIDFK